MADIELAVLVEKSDDTDKVIFAIDGRLARPDSGKTRTATVSRPGTYDYDYFIVGVPGATASYEVKRGDDVVLTKKERTIRPGKRLYAGSGKLTVS